MDLFEKDQSIKELLFFEAVTRTDEKNIRLPLYQRDAVWSEGRVCALWDSILRGFPLPLFLLVAGKEGSRSLTDDGKRKSTDTNTEGDYFDLLDGQQRLNAIRGVTLSKNSTVRLWLDLAPPSNPPHPFKFKYWLHPCTNIFPFGFRMEKSGEHDFRPLEDKEIREIWEKLQKQAGLESKDFYQIPLADSFPWHAHCPVPLDEVVGLIRNNNTEIEVGALTANIIEIAEKYKKAIKPYEKECQSPDNSVLDKVVKALINLQKRKLAFQLIELSDDEEDGYTLFERIGRGGVQISQRQLAVSQLMLILGTEGNDVIASFQETKWGALLDTEDVVHALARIAYAMTNKMPEIESVNFDRELRDWDMFDLSTDRLKTMKKDSDHWKKFSEKLKFISEETRLKSAFNNIFEALQFKQDENENGFPLVQLAQTNRSGEGISPITLHPLLLWIFKYGGDPLLEKELRDDMLRWIMFANGIASKPKHEGLNRAAFYHVCQRGRLNFALLKSTVFNNETLSSELGFVCNLPKIDSKGEVVLEELKYKDVPTPKEIVELFARRLILQNVAANGVSKFVLMWNQREALHDMYGATDVQHLPALFSKGRPFDLDHIVARNRFLYSATGIYGNSLLAGAQGVFVQKDILKKSILNEECFRKNLPNMNANYRYWPKHLNRADQDCVVKDKMSLAIIVKQSGNHPLSKNFKGKQDDIGWEWSSIPLQDKSEWECLPPEDYTWNAELIAKFIRIILRREYYLYRNAYLFLNPDCKLNDDFNPDGIIDSH
ncbi:MAG: DUF262 domain-containing protein [Methylobacter sp.]|nr:DUF262 domain-containing protein [Candidatus Methylobacter titanis]